LSGLTLDPSPGVADTSCEHGTGANLPSKSRAVSGRALESQKLAGGANPEAGRALARVAVIALRQLSAKALIGCGQREAH